MTSEAAQASIRQIVSKIDTITKEITDIKREEDRARHYQQLRATIQDLRSKQQRGEQAKKKGKSTAAVSGPTAKDYEQFKEWLCANGCPAQFFDAIDFSAGLHEGAGVVAKRDVPKGELLLQIPQRLMLSSAIPEGSEDPLHVLIKRDPRLSHKSSKTTVLVLLLLREKHNPSSFWTPYLRILPRKFNTCLYFSGEEFDALRGSPAQAHSYKVLTTVAKQYAYIYQLLTTVNTLDKQSMPLHLASFTWDDFVWATSVTMTRQNAFPISVPHEPDVVLVPGWDMCNHAADGEITTEYDPKAQSVDFRAMQPYKKGEQIYIFYGPRPGVELLIHNGFVVDNNPYDYVQVRVRMAHDTPAIRQKLVLLHACNMKMDEHYNVGHAGVPSDMIAFFRIYALNEEEATSIVGQIDKGSDKGKEKESASNDTLGGFDPFVVLNPRNEDEARRMLIASLVNHLSVYSTTKEEDESLLKNGNPSEKKRLIIRFRLIEKKIILAAVAQLNGGAVAPTKKNKKKRNRNKKKKSNATAVPATTTTTDTKPVNEAQGKV